MNSTESIARYNADESAYALESTRAFEQACRDVTTLTWAMAPAYVLDDIRGDQSLDAITEYWNEHGRVSVASGHSDHTIFVSAADNYAMRAWHDLTHILLGVGFDASDERRVAESHQRAARAFYTRRGYTIGATSDALAVLWFDTAGQNLYYARHWAFPTDQRAFVRACFNWMRAYVRNHPRAANTDLHYAAAIATVDVGVKY